MQDNCPLCNGKCCYDRVSRDRISHEGAESYRHTCEACSNGAKAPDFYSKTVESVMEGMKRSPGMFSHIFLEMLGELPMESHGRRHAETLVNGCLMVKPMAPAPVAPAPVVPAHVVPAPVVRRKRCKKCGELGHNSVTCGNKRPEPKPKVKTQERRRLEVESRHPRFFELAGSMTDTQLTEVTGLSRQRVQQLRREFGIEAYTKPFSPTPEFLEALGKKSDRDLAEEFGISACVVSNHRNSKGIPQWSPVLHNDELIERHIEKLGKMSDPKFAEMAGVPNYSVFDYRKRKGIKTEIMAPTHEDFVPLDRNKVSELFHQGQSDEEIAKALGSTKGSISRLRTHELGLLRGEAPKLSDEGERKRVIKVWKECGENISETARRTGRSASFISRLTRKSRGGR